jgi:hypothetical protein
MIVGGRDEGSTRGFGAIRRVRSGLLEDHELILGHEVCRNEGRYRRDRDILLAALISGA